MSIQRAILVVLAVGMLPAPSAQAQGQGFTPQLKGQALVDALRKGGHVLLLRHMATDSFVPDADVFDVADCSTQRNLSALGREQAARLGQAIEKLEVPIGQVLSSPYCRCRDTATLAFQKVETAEILSVGDDLSGEEKDARGKEIRTMLGTAPADGTNDVLITHTGSLLYSFGLQSRPEGIAHVFRPSVVGAAAYVGFLTPDEWLALAGIERPAP